MDTKSNLKKPKLETLFPLIHLKKDTKRGLDII